MDGPLAVQKNPGLSVCGNGLAVQGIDFLKNGLKSLFQLLFGPWFSFGSGKLAVISNGAPVKIGRFSQQFSLGIILGGHISILQENVSSASLNKEGPLPQMRTKALNHVFVGLAAPQFEFS
jgi:hypothetical protein